ncbi:hypothetical protein M8J77_001079 [Diaphorina citri]|nr:hypothetical protein M8J77_001079 [Diaphorina citri]
MFQCYPKMTKTASHVDRQSPATLQNVICYVIQYFGGHRHLVPVSEVYDMVKTLTAARQMPVPQLESFEKTLSEMDSKVILAKAQKEGDKTYVQLKEKLKPETKTCTCGRCNKDAATTAGGATSGNNARMTTVSAYHCDPSESSNATSTIGTHRCLKTLKAFRQSGQKYPYNKVYSCRCSKRCQPVEPMETEGRIFDAVQTENRELRSV